MDGRFVGFYVAAVAVSLMVGLPYYNLPQAKTPLNVLFTERCKYDTTVLCADCFTEPANCSTFTNIVTSKSDMAGVFNRFNRHSVRLGLLHHTEEPVFNFNNLNRDKAIEKLRNSVCRENGTINCVWRNNQEYIKVLRQRVLDDYRIKGAIFCPSWDARGLTRFVEKFKLKHLLTLMMMATNTQSLMVRMLSIHKLPVPYFVIQRGFTLVENYDGEPLSKFYQTPLTLRLKIASSLIDAFLRFNTGVYNFRFFMTNMSPQNIFVNVLPDEDVDITFVELSNMVIIDETSEVHLGSPHTNDCAKRYNDISSHTVCQLLLENRFGDTEKGFLHNTENDLELAIVREMLHYCVYCKEPNCKDRQKLLKDIEYVIDLILYNDD